MNNRFSKGKSIQNEIIKPIEAQIISHTKHTCIKCFSKNITFGNRKEQII